MTIHSAVGGASSGRIYDSGPLSYTGRVLEEDFNIPDRRCRGPLVLCVYVEFEEQGGGEVTFTGAGARFEEWT